MSHNQMKTIYEAMTQKNNKSQPLHIYA